MEFLEEIDSIDRSILAALQEDCSRSVQEIGEQVGLTQNPCWRRIRRLEEAGLIRKRVALLDAERPGTGVTVFVTVRTNQHNDAWLENFAGAVSKIPEVVEFYRMSGQIDYLLKILVRDIDDYDRIYRKLIQSAELFDVSSSFAMEQLKYTTAVPIPER
jgi:Lrp/AsnC family transcriptional regulator